MKKTDEIRLRKLEIAKVKARGAAFVVVPRGQTLEQAMVEQGIRVEEYETIFSIHNRPSKGPRTLHDDRARNRPRRYPRA